MQDHARTEMRVWIGFAVGSSIALLITILFSERMTAGQIGAIWTVAISAGFINHGIWDRERIMILSGSLSSAVTLISLAFAPMFFPVGWIILGCGLAVSGFYSQQRTECLVGVYLTLGGVIQLLSAYLSTSALSVWALWMVLVGLVFIAVSMGTKNPVMHFFGCLLDLGVCSQLHLLSRTHDVICRPRLRRRDDRELCLPVQTSWKNAQDRRGHLLCHPRPVPKGLKKPIDQYRVLAILIKGNIGAENVIHDLMSRLEPRCAPILLLSPTAPTQLSLPKEAKVGWVTTVSGVSKLDYPILSPEDPTMVSVFLTKTLGTLPEDEKPVILGDFSTT